MPEIYIGTSGWLYSWNIEGTLDWYLQYSRLNAVELNASFYRIPWRNQVLSWARKGSKIRWAIKIHRIITHTLRLVEKSYNYWDKFYNTFKPMEKLVDFYLLQLPPNYKYTEKNVEKLRRFTDYVELGPRLAIEYRHKSWFKNETGVKLAEELGATVVSIDSPIATWIVSTNDIVYLRVHGRKQWYAYNYAEEELEQIAEEILEINPRKIYVFFNNNHWMLENAQIMKKILTEETQTRDS